MPKDKNLEDERSQDLLVKWQADDKEALKALWTLQEKELNRIVKTAARGIRGHWPALNDFRGKVFERIHNNQREQPLTDLDAFFSLVKAHAGYQRKVILRVMKKETNRFSDVDLADLEIDASQTIWIFPKEDGNPFIKKNFNFFAKPDETHIFDLLTTLMVDGSLPNWWYRHNAQLYYTSRH